MDTNNWIYEFRNKIFSMYAQTLIDLNIFKLSKNLIKLSYYIQ